MSSKKELFITEVEQLIGDMKEKLSSDAYTYWLALSMTDEGTPVTKLTDNGRLVIKYMQENKDLKSNFFQAKKIGEAIGVSSRTVSGAMRKLVNDGYVEKLGSNPAVYALTEAGVNLDIE